MFITLNSKNAKLGNCAASYLPIKQTCPSSCPLKDGICYAKYSYVGMHQQKLSKKLNNYCGFDIVRMEAREIKSLGPNAKGKSLRLHVSGDVKTDKMAKLLGDAVKFWDGKVWSYSHSWRTISRKSFGSISVLASVETFAEAKQALKKGYAPAISVPFHDNPKAYNVDGLKIIPCPAQTKDITCEQCKLCMQDKMLLNQNAVIAFALHGVGKKKQLKVIK